MFPQDLPPTGSLYLRVEEPERRKMPIRSNQRLLRDSSRHLPMSRISPGYPSSGQLSQCAPTRLWTDPIGIRPYMKDPAWAMAVILHFRLIEKMRGASIQNSAVRCSTPGLCSQLPTMYTPAHPYNPAHQRRNRSYNPPTVSRLRYTRPGYMQAVSAYWEFLKSASGELVC